MMYLKAVGRVLIPRKTVLSFINQSKRSICCFCGHHAKQSLLQAPNTLYVTRRGWYKPTSHTVWVPDKPRERRPAREDIAEGLDVLRKGIPEWKQEWIDRFKCDHRFIPLQGDYEYFVKFDEPQTLKKWVVSTDRDSGMGKSNASFSMTSQKTALFHGFLNTEVPKDGDHKNAGFCNVRSPVKTISFERQVPYDWSRYTHMFLKVRGDGRNYMLNIHMNHYFDLHWGDMHQFPLYTRGGPYWQITKVPFSKFYLAHTSRVQDVQEETYLDRIKYFSISVMDGAMGNFNLELDSIALVRDNSTDNTFEYEMYNIQSLN